MTRRRSVGGLQPLVRLTAKEERANRIDAMGRAFAGSQLQTQIYATRRKNDLNVAVRQALSAAGGGAAAIEWTAPLEARRFQEPFDQTFLAALKLAAHSQALREFWPAGGPKWDALAIFDNANRSGDLLVEAKSYPAEIYGGGCKATSPRSRELIRLSLERTQHWLGASASNWLGKLYQYGNRLAHVFFLREVLGVDAWLVNLCFTDDVTTVPTTTDYWQSALASVKRELGFQGDRIAWVVDVLLPAGTREDLTGQGAP